MADKASLPEANGPYLMNANLNGTNTPYNADVKKRGTKCCIWNCWSYPGDKSQNISFHRFPKDVEERQSWLKVIGPNSIKSNDPSLPQWTPSASSRICELHFSKSSPNVGSKLIHRKLSRNKKRLLFESEKTEPINKPLAAPSTSMSNNLNLLISDGNESFPCAEVTIPRTSKPDLGVGFSKPNDINHLTSLEHDQAIKEENVQLKTRNSHLDEEISSLKEEIKSLNLALTSASNKIIQMDLHRTINDNKRRMFRVEEIIDDDVALKFYTGFETKERYLIFCQFMMNGYEAAQNQVNGRENPQKASNRKPIIDPMNQLFLVLCRLRVGLLEQDLAYRCNVSVSTIKNIWCFWIDYLATTLLQIPIWPSRKLVNEHMPAEFSQLYPSTRVILDCTEIFIENPSEFRVQSDTYSSYKSHNTAKGLLGISPNGAITFVSDLSPGRVSDKELTLSSGLLNLLDPADTCMADRGFVIEDELKCINVGLNIPPFMNGKTSLSCEEERTTREIASLRIHVERVIRQIKTFRILKHTFPNSMSDKLNKIWKICCYLLNFMGNPLLEKNKPVEK